MVLACVVRTTKQKKNATNTKQCLGTRYGTRLMQNNQNHRQTEIEEQEKRTVMQREHIRSVDTYGTKKNASFSGSTPTDDKIDEQQFKPKKQHYGAKNIIISMPSGLVMKEQKTTSAGKANK